MRFPGFKESAMGRLSARAVLVVVLCLSVAAMAGCGTLNTQKNTYISVQCSGDRMLHMAIIPRVLPDGQPAAKQRDALLKDLADAAGGYTLIERVMSAWKQDDSSEAAKQTADDLLLVAGPPQLGPGLRQRLHDDFGQSSPFVLSLPIQSVQVVQAMPNAPGTGEPTPPAPAQ
jgi:hypothetical protein